WGRLWVPDGRKRGGGERVRLARDRKLCGQGPHDEGLKSNPVLRAVRGGHVYFGEFCGRPRLWPRGPAGAAQMKVESTVQLRVWQSSLEYFWRQLLRNKLSFIAVCAIVTLAAIALFAPWIAPFDPDEPDASAVLQPPQWRHWLGTDDYGRDELSRV